MSLVSAIIADPDDDAPRRVYADWLADRGDAWGELIHVQCRLARLAPDDDAAWAPLRRRELELLRTHEPLWRRQHRVSGWTWERGFPRAVQLAAAPRWADVSALFAAFPIRELALHHLDPPGLAELAALPELGRVERLQISSSPIHGHLATLVASPHLGRLRALSLAHTALSGADAAALVAAPWLDQLEVLELGYSEVRAAVVHRALSLPRLRRLGLEAVFPGVLGALPPSLRELDLSNNHIDHHAAAAIAATPSLAQLESLSLKHGSLAPADLVLVLRSPHLGGLRHLTLDFPFSDATADAVGAMAALEVLELLRPDPEDRGLRALARCPLPRLRRLRTTFTSKLDAGARDIADADWPALAELELRTVHPLGLAALAGSRRALTLQRLELAHNPVEDVGLANIAAASWPRLRSLGLRNTGIGDAGAKALARAPGLPTLVEVDVSGSPALTASGKRALHARFGAGLVT